MTVAYVKPPNPGGFNLLRYFRLLYDPLQVSGTERKTDQK